MMMNLLLISPNIWCKNILCRCSNGDVCHVDAQMMNDTSVQVRVACIHLKQ